MRSEKSKAKARTLRPRDDMNHHIHRLDVAAERIHSWRVQILRRGKSVLRQFPDQTYGGKRAALKAARAFRDAELAKIDQVAYKLWAASRLRRNSTSGVSGVTRYAPLVRLVGGAIERPFWQAYWMDARGRKRTRKFAVNKYGEEGAKRHAIAARKAAINEQLQQGRSGNAG